MEPAVSCNRQKRFDLIDFHKSSTCFYLCTLLEYIYQLDTNNQFD